MMTDTAIATAAINDLPIDDAIDAIRAAENGDRIARQFVTDAMNDGELYSAEEYNELASKQTASEAEYDELLNSLANSATRLHEAICEGRRQDAVDILNEVTDLNFRTVAAQMNLFPDRVSL